MEPRCNEEQKHPNRDMCNTPTDQTSILMQPPPTATHTSVPDVAGTQT